MRSWLRLVTSSFAVAGLILACGSRTGLPVPEPPTCPDDLAGCAPDVTTDAPGDRTLVDARDATTDAPADAPLFEGGVLDVVTDCAQPAYCDPRDPGYVYKCGVRIVQCSSLEQCEQVGGADGGDAGVATCVNPCLDTLGQDTSNGCEFYAAEIDTTQDTAGACYAVYIVNQWKTGEPARIAVDLGGQPMDVSQFARIPVGTGQSITYAPFDPNAGLPKDQIAILFLSRDPNATGNGNPSDPAVLAGCPPGVTPAVVGDAALHGTGVGTAFHLRTNVPVVAYQILPYGGGRARVTGATLLLPTNVWGTNYLAANAYAPPSGFGEARAGPTMMILGKEDGTNVTINPVRAIQPGGALAGAAPGVATTYTVNRGQYLQFTQFDELTGSPILADKPVAVVSAATLMDVPLAKTRADSAEQMLPPVTALGSEYVAIRFRARRNRGDEEVPWRMIGAVDGTTLSYDPAPPAGAPTTLDARQVAEFTSPGRFVVRSQDAAHPFYMAEYMTGGLISSDPTNEQPSDGEGDPEYVNVVPPAQYLPRYTFFTDPTYPETNLVVVRARDASLNAFPDVSLDCAGSIVGWQDVGTSGQYQYALVDLSTGDFQGIGACNNGVHTIAGAFPGVDSAAPVPRFGVTVWGWGNTITLPIPNDLDPRSTRWVSYGYPAGANFGALNAVVVTP